MSRRRYLSTNISTDPRVNKLAQRGGDFAALLYTWMIPHCADDATISGDPDELLMSVVPGRRDKSAEDVAAALAAMDELGLIVWDRDGMTVSFPPAAFYGYQTYIPDGKRRGAHNTADARETTPEPAESREAAVNSADQRKTPQNAAYPSPSPSVSPSPSPSPSGPSVDGPRARHTPTRTIKTPVPDDMAERVPPEAWAAMGREQHLTDEQLRFETAAMIDHYRGKGERRADWVATWRQWMRSPYRQSKAVNGQGAPNGAGPGHRPKYNAQGQRVWTMADLRDEEHRHDDERDSEIVVEAASRLAAR